MTIQIPVRMPTFIRVELTVDGRSDLDRVIEMPARAPLDWIAEAYLLSVGLDPIDPLDDDGYERCHHDEPYSYPWPRIPSAADLPSLPHDPRAVVTEVKTPEIGAPWLSVSRPARERSGSGQSVFKGSWLTDSAPFDEDAVNRELLRAHGVVQPHFDDGDIWTTDPRISPGSPLASLARALSPARRLALLAHVEHLDLNREPAPDYSEAESALAPLARLIDAIGAEGMVQDAVGGWVPRAECHRVAQAIGWSGSAHEMIAQGEALVAFARSAGLIRRLKGRVVATTRARALVVPSTQTLGILAQLAMAREGRASSYATREHTREQALALLAVADQTVQHLDDLPSAVAEGQNLFVDQGVRLEALAYGRAPVDDPQVAIDRLQDRLSVFSLAGAFGRVTPSMREIARLALVGGGAGHRYA